MNESDRTGHLLQAESHTAYSQNQTLMIMLGLGSALMLVSLDQTIVATALTAIAVDLHEVALYGWVLAAYLLTSTATTPLYGKLSDQFGRKRIFQISILIFLAGSALSGLSQNMYQLIGFRAVQGLGAGGLATLVFVISADVVAPRERGRYQSYLAAVGVISSFSGPLIGGFLVTAVSWRWVFYINLPVGVIGLLVIQRLLELDSRSRSSKVDMTGSALIVSGISLILVAVQVASSAARITGTAWAFGGPGILLLAVFIWWETRAADPIIPLSLIRLRTVAIASFLALVSGAIWFVVVIFIPLYLQSVRGASPTMSGLRMLPLLFGYALATFWSGRLSSKLGRYKLFLVAGNAMLTAAVAVLGGISVSTSPWPLAGMLVLTGFGLGLLIQLLVVTVQNAVPPEHVGAGTALVSLFRYLGGAVGTAVIGATLALNEKYSLPGYERRFGRTSHAAESHAFAYGLDRAFMYALPVAAVALILSCAIREVHLPGRSAP